MTEIEWQRAIVRVDPGELARWLACRPDNRARLESTAPATGRDNYGLVGKRGRKARDHDRSKWEAFQKAVAPCPR